MPDDLVLVAFPHQLLHAMAALDEERRSRNDPAPFPVVIFVWCYEPSQHFANSAFRRLFGELVRAYPEARLVFPSYAARMTRLSPLRPIRDRADAVRSISGIERVRIFAYAHDISADHMAQAGLQAWPSALSLCFGDPPGFLYSNDDIRASGEKAPKLRLIAAGGRQPDRHLQWRYAQSIRVAIQFDGAAAGHSECPVNAIPGSVLREHLRRMIDALGPAHSDRQRKIVQSPGTTAPHLLLLSNFTESGMTTRAAERNLYVQLIEQLVPRGSTLWIKPHPGTSSRFLRQIAQAASPYRVRPLEGDLARQPVETLDVLIKTCNVVSVSSSSALLAKLYGAAGVKHGLSPAMIDTHFAPRWRSRFNDANFAILSALAAERLHGQP